MNEIDIYKIKLYQWFINNYAKDDINVINKYYTKSLNILYYYDKSKQKNIQLKQNWTVDEIIESYNNILKLYGIEYDKNILSKNELKIKFSNNKDNYIGTGQKMDVSYIDNIICDCISKENNYYIKMTNCPYRMDNINFNPLWWNNCVAIDIDYKKAYDEFKIDPKIIYNDVYIWLMNNCREIIYYTETSRSTKGYHFIFHINAPKTYDGIKYALAVANDAITKAFIQCGYTKIIFHDGVLDDCTKTIVQGIYLTGLYAKINNECTGMSMAYYEKNKNDILKQIENIKYKDLTTAPYPIEYTDIIRKKFEGITVNDLKTMFEKCKIYTHINRNYRWTLFIELFSILIGANIFTEDNLKTLWTILIKKMPIGKHDVKYYINEPYNFDWNKKKDINNLRNPVTMKQLGIIKIYDF